VPEAVRHGTHGLLVPPEQPELLADAIAALVTDPGRRATMGTAAADRAEDFDATRAVRRIETIYRRVASR
jgi:glycosyltransferase involved in cell wall biosynthesis